MFHTLLIAADNRKMLFEKKISIRWNNFRQEKKTQ